jgi:hypothetical protein
MVNWKFEVKPLTDIRPWDKNPRKFNKKGLEDLSKSISKFGLPEPIILNADNSIIGGHARFHVLQTQKASSAFCIVADRQLTDDEHGELNIRLNKNVAGLFDDEKLLELFNNTDLMEMGFTAGELEKSSDAQAEAGAELEISNELMEEYEYVVIFAKNSIDKNNLFEMLDIQREKNYKSTHIGVGRVVDYAKFVKCIDRIKSGVPKGGA